nr:cell division protein ZapA [uncultured bacterium]
MRSLKRNPRYSTTNATLHLEGDAFERVRYMQVICGLAAEEPSQTMNQQSVRVEIFDQTYNLRGTDAEYITRLAEYVDAKIRTIAQQTATVDSVRLAVLAAINIADELHIIKRQHESLSSDCHSRAKDLFGALDAVLEPARLAG